MIHRPFPPNAPREYDIRIVIIGGPASGKSTLTDLLTARDPNVQTFGVRRFFAGQLTQGTPLGARAKTYVKNNAWIPDDIVIEGVVHELRHRLGRSFILEGMPGNARQAALLDEALSEHGLPLDAAVHVETPTALTIERAGRRLVCLRCDGGSHQVVLDGAGNCAGCGEPPARRESDGRDTFLKRVETHAGHAAELVEHYAASGRLVSVSGVDAPATMLDRCTSALAMLRRRPSHQGLMT